MIPADVAVAVPVGALCAVGGFIIGYWLSRLLGLREVAAVQAELGALRAERTTAQVKTIKLRGKLSWLESQLSIERRLRHRLGRRLLLEGIKADQSEGAAELSEVSLMAERDAEDDADVKVVP